MIKKHFVDEDTFFEMMFEFVKAEKKFNFYIKDKSDDELKFFKSSYKHECGHTFLFIEFDGNWSQMMLWEDIYGNQITWDEIREHLLYFFSYHTLNERTYCLYCLD